MKRSPLRPGREGLIRRTALRARSWLDRSTPLRKVNRERKEREFHRCYGSVSRVMEIKALQCAVPGCNGWPVENAHLGNGGKGRKSGWYQVVPLCTDFANGHHTALDEGCAGDVERFDARFGTDLYALAERLSRELTP